MARQVLPILGGLVGSYFGYPQLGFVIGGVLGQLADPQVGKGPALGELQAQTSNEGSPRAIIYGTATCTGYVIAFGPAQKTTEVVEGEKGAPKSEQEVVYRSYAVAICEGPIHGLLRVWENDKLVFDVRPGSLMLAESIQWSTNKFLHLGDEDQLPNIFMEQTISGVGTTPAYRGTAYMYFNLEDVTDTRGAIKQYRWEVANSVAEVALTKYPSDTAVGATSTGSAFPPGTLNHFVQPIGFAVIRPLMKAQASRALTPALTPPIRIIVSLNEYDLPILDTGWFGDPSVQAELDLLLEDQGREDLKGPIGSGRAWENAFHLSEFPTSGDAGRIDIYRAQTTSSPPSGNYSVSILRPDPLAAPPEYTFHPTVEGVGIEPDQSMFAAEWGPDEVLVVGGPDAAVPLGDIVADLCDRSSLVEGDDFDVSELDDLVMGLTLTGDYTAGDAINTLRSCYFFDKAEPGDKIYFPKRGKPVVTTVAIEDLVDVPDLSKREQVAEVPKKMHLMYQHPTAGYAPVKATYERSSVDVQSVVESTTQVPVVLNENQARQMVHKQMKVTTADAQGEIKLTLPDRFIRLIPSDSIGLSLRGQVRRLRIEESEWSDGVLSKTLRLDRQSAYTSALTGIAIPEPELPPPTIVGDTSFVFADVPSRSDTEDDLHYLVAGAGALPGWYGWLLQRSTDGGANYAGVDQFSRADVVGYLLDAVSVASEHYTDTTNSVRVQLHNANHALEDLAEVQFLSEGGAFLLQKDDGSYEVLQYRDALDEGDGVFVLSHLHRGRLNSGAAEHSVGAQFVLLSSAHHIPAQSAWIGQALTHRPVSFGQSPELAAPQTDTYVGRSQLEWPVADLTLGRDGSDVISGAWVPRHRFGTDDAPVASINFQGYRVTLDDGVLPAITLDTPTPGFTYDASALGAPLAVSVQAVNRITGPGPSTTESI
jgi:hypothetical protein